MNPIWWALLIAAGGGPTADPLDEVAPAEVAPAEVAPAEVAPAEAVSDPLFAFEPAATNLPVQRFALVIGNNHPLPGSGYQPLRYADDDALRFATFMKGLGARVILLAGPDRESAERFGGLADQASAPTRGGLERAIDVLERAIESAPPGAKELFFFFSGHGTMTSARAFLHLLDGEFTRTDLHELLLRRLAADRMHVIIDSCHSYFLVNARGERIPVDEDEEDLRRYPAVGFLLSTSARKEVHEWSGYEAGVFSYQVLGALSGAADVDNDGVVTYAEVRGYVVAANLGVSDSRARIQPFVKKPTVRGEVIADLRQVAAEGKVRLPEKMRGHLHLVDKRGSRLLDANKAAGQPLVIFAPTAAELRLRDEVYAIRPLAGAPATAELTTAGDGLALAARGLVEDAFRKELFSRPLTSEFVAGLDAAEIDHTTGAPLELAASWDDDPVTVGYLVAGGALLTSAAVFTGLYLHGRAQADRFTSGAVILKPTEYESLRGRAERDRAIFAAGYVGGAALLTAGLVRAYLTNGSRLSFAPAGSGVSVTATW